MMPGHGARAHLVERAAEMLTRPRSLVPSQVSPNPPSPNQAWQEKTLPEPMVREPVVSEPVVSEPVVSEPVVPEQAVPEQAVPEPVRVEPILAEPIAAVPAPPPASAQLGGTAALPRPAYTGTPFTAPIPLATLHAAGLLSAPLLNGQARTREEIAMVQHQVLRLIDDAPPGASPQSNIVMVASALPREGKSFMALNLAWSIASRGARPVLLVDADGQGGSLTHLLGVSRKQGLRELIAAPSRRGTDLVLPAAVDRLWFLPIGLSSEDHAASETGGTCAAALQRLAAALPDHVIILDSQPCLASSESTALARIAGQVVLVIGAETTSRVEVEAALDALDACPVLRLVLNRARFGSHGSLGSYTLGSQGPNAQSVDARA